MSVNFKDSDIREILDRLSALELRMSKIESGISSELPTETLNSDDDIPELLKSIPDSAKIESKIGESGLAWLGNFVLFFGITFLVQYIQNSGHILASSIFGFLSVAGIFAMSHYLKKTYPKMGSLFQMNAWVVLFYVVLRLHFFSLNPLIQNKFIGLILMFIVVASHLFTSIKAKSAFLTGVSLVLISAMALISNSTHLMLLLSVLIAIISVVCLSRFNWIRLVYAAIVLSYLINLMWFLNNPLISHQMQAITVYNMGYVYLFVLAVIFSFIGFTRNPETYSDSSIIGAIIVNGIAFSLLLLFYGLSIFKDDYVLPVGLVSAFCLLYSVVLQRRSELKIIPAIYALYGFVTLSLSLYGIYFFPKVYFLLAIQSLLVVSMAIWFRSKFIVLMNTFLFITLLIFYGITSSLIDGVNVSFLIVALLTERILSWKQERLTIRTLHLGNTYMIIAFIMTLITLNHLIPGKYVSLSWTFAAVFYFILSFLLKNIKYRYFVIGIILAAAIHLFLIDLANIDLVFRIIALMFLAIISIGLSIYYSKKIKEKAS